MEQGCKYCDHLASVFGLFEDPDIGVCHCCFEEILDITDSIAAIVSVLVPNPAQIERMRSAQYN